MKHPCKYKSEKNLHKGRMKGYLSKVLVMSYLWYQALRQSYWLPLETQGDKKVMDTV